MRKLQLQSACPWLQVRGMKQKRQKEKTWKNESDNGERNDKELLKENRERHSQPKSCAQSPTASQRERWRSRYSHLVVWSSRSNSTMINGDDSLVTTRRKNPRHSWLLIYSSKRTNISRRREKEVPLQEEALASQAGGIWESSARGYGHGKEVVTPYQATKRPWTKKGPNKLLPLAREESGQDAKPQFPASGLR
jgi:hypothetical protein